MLFAVIGSPGAIFDVNRFRFPREIFVVFGCLIPFQLILLITMSGGIDSVGTASAALVNFMVLPIIILLVWRRWYTDDMLLLILRTLRFCVYAAAIYGLFLFFCKLLTGKLLEITFLTISGAQTGLIEDKDNLRGGLVMKLVSTYNNGNIYGAATILLLPIFDCIESKRVHKMILRAALLLTLSRTAWFGILLDQALTSGSHLIGASRYLPKVNVRSLKSVLLSLCVVFGITAFVVGLAWWLPNGIAMLADQSLSGRSEQLEIIHSFSLLPSGSYSGFSEMVFLSALRQFGLVGFLSTLILFLCPVGFGLVDKEIYASPIRKAAVKGLFLYFAMAWIDGAIDLIPVMAFYWFVVALAIYGKNSPSIRSSRLLMT
jgi:hypothetical protein